MKKQEEIKIKEKVVFEFAYEKNAERVALALCMSGYYVKIRHDVGYFVCVYEHDDSIIK